TVRKADAVGVLQIGRRLHDHAHRPARMEDSSSFAKDFGGRHDLRSGRENQPRMIMDAIGHCGCSANLSTQSKFTRLANLLPPGRVVAGSIAHCVRPEERLKCWKIHPL